MRRCFNWGGFAVAVVVFLSACLIWPVGLLIDWWQVRSRPSQPRLARLARLWAGTTVAVNLVAIVVVTVTLSRVAQPSVATEFQAGLPWMLKRTIDVATLAAALSLAVPAFAVLAWIRHYWTLTSRVQYSLLATACLAYVWFCSFWNLIGF